MRRVRAHRWDVTPAEARAIQERLRSRIVTRGRPRVRSVAGIDVGFEAPGFARAAVVVLSYPGLEELACAVARRRVTFPYVPGLLSFRECPVALAALARLDVLPDLLVCDGQGRAHPRRFGLACHLGLLAGIPSIGVAKTRLVGDYGQLPQAKGAWVPLLDHGERIGAVLRTRTGVNPVFVSVGHRVSLAVAIDIAMGCVTRYRLPETTRRAHRLASATPCG